MQGPLEKWTKPSKIVVKVFEKLSDKLLIRSAKCLKFWCDPSKEWSGVFLKWIYVLKNAIHGVFRPFLQKSMNNVMIFIVA